MTITIEPPRDPKTPEEWQNAADALLKIGSARIYGLVSFAGGPEIDADRCWVLVHWARELHGIEPREDAVERFLSAFERAPDGDAETEGP